MAQGVKIKGRRRPDEVARSAKGRRRRPVERAPEAPRFHVCALRAHFQQKYGKEKHERDKQGSFPGSFVRSTVQVPVKGGGTGFSLWERASGPRGFGGSTRFWTSSGASRRGIDAMMPSTQTQTIRTNQQKWRHEPRHSTKSKNASENVAPVSQMDVSGECLSSRCKNQKWPDYALPVQRLCASPSR